MRQPILCTSYPDMAAILYKQHLWLFQPSLFTQRCRLQTLLLLLLLLLLVVLGTAQHCTISRCQGRLQW